MPDVVKVIGNPGTGKTRYLVEYTAELLQQGVPPDEIAYLTFTRKAAQEAMERLAQLTGLDSTAFKWVRTLHSLAYSLLGVVKEQMITEADIQHFLHSVGASDELEGKQLVQMHSYSRVMNISLEEAWDRMRGTVPVSWLALQSYDRIYNRFKEIQGRYDFQDLLELYKENPIIPRFHTVIVDEAQDLSSLQWDIICLLAAQARVLMLAGDPHQAIYNWAGADAGILTSVPGVERILPQSYRIPATVQQAARFILRRYSDPERYPYRPAEHSGQVHRLARLNYQQLDFRPENGSWLFLARNEIFLVPVKNYLYNQGLKWEAKGALGKMISSAGIEKIARHIGWYESWCKSGEITPGRLAKLKTLCSHAERSALMNQPWYEAFDALPAADKNYYINAKKGATATITLSTMHGSKGTEADNVVILGDYTRAVDEAFQSHPAQEYACLYVGLTRAKKNLYLVEPEKRAGYNWQQLLR